MILQTPTVQIKSNIVYSSPKEAIKMLNSNNIINNEFNKVVENFRIKKLLECSRYGSMPNLKSKVQLPSSTTEFGNFMRKPSIDLRKLKFNNTMLKGYRKQPKIRISQLPKYEGKRKTVKMDPKALKAGIARFILRSVTTSIPTSIQDNPFTKIIQLPKMMGFDNRIVNKHILKEPPLYFWHKKNIISWSPKSREQGV